ncbi:2-phospho-L-lactate guanylyltransferase [Cryobacterium frigoriphilum]|uniref:Phosphoenolpyruvate guanylyltransferase n=1 Tax=Cryobacterium frigoriphilum TaxID=1259150 RepID=A0A4R8ZW50_9MICO|nr:2-phospho-L-lactate guanylyltransferase [Cryobacterium frigoriphilum]TFD47709.1 2-phospho-L-lactate guanylyltransferase [Cryobacterium frigoriphilum]
MSWVVVVPVKGNPGAKTRLEALPERAALADAFALDTVAALVAASTVERVVVVTADAALGVRLAALGAVIVPETRAAGDPLNAAIVQGADAARRLAPTAHLAIVTGDLPALRSDDVDHALRLAARHECSMMPDAEGTGTTMLLARVGVSLTPRFGLGSRAAHEAAGHVPLEVAATASIRRDVDTPADLEVARTLGLGPHTAALLAADALPAGQPR